MSGKFRSAGDVFWRAPYSALMRSVLLTALILLVNPLNLASGTSKYSETIVFRLLAPFYDQDSQPRVTVILLDDASIEAMNPGDGYPLPHSMHGEIIESILCNAPNRLFVDFLFSYSRDDRESAEFLHSLARRPIDGECPELAAGDPRLKTVSPVYLARQFRSGSRCNFLHGETTAASASDDCPAHPLEAMPRYTIPVSLAGTPDESRYLLFTRNTQRADTDRTAATLPEFTPAAAMYQDACARGFDATGCSSLGEFRKLIRRHVDGGTEANLALQFGTGASDLFAPGCRKSQQAGSFLSRLAISLNYLAAELAGDLAWWDPGYGEGQWCPSVDALSVNAFAKLEADDPELARSLIENRFVFYGADITGIPDQTHSAVIGSVAGVFSHAIAADNLLRYGASYWRDPGDFRGVPLDRLTELAITTLLLLYGWGLANRAHRILPAPAPQGNSATARLLRPHRSLLSHPDLTYFLVSLLVVAGSALASAVLLSWAPINWLGIMGLIAVTNPMPPAETRN